MLRVLALRAGCPDRSWLEGAPPSNCTEQLVLCFSLLGPAWRVVSPWGWVAGGAFISALLLLHPIFPVQAGMAVD